MNRLKFRVYDSCSKQYIKDLSNFWISPADFNIRFMEFRPDLDGETVF